MQTLKSLPLQLHRRFNLPSNPISSRFSSFTKTPKPTNTFLFNYLIETFNFPKQKALYISSHYYYIKTLEKPHSVLYFLRSLGLSEAHICSSVCGAPHILFYDVHNTLKPKIEFFQQLGLVGSPDLGKFLSKNSNLLTVSLERKLIPCTEIVKKILIDDKNNEDLIKVFRRCNWIAAMDPGRRLLSNIAYFESCGIVGTQLSMLLRRQPRLFTAQETKVKELVSRVLDIGFSVDSRLLVHGLYTISCMSEETFQRKLELFRSFGFLDRECMEMFRRSPGLLRTSSEKLSLGLEFFLNKIEFEKKMLVNNPKFLMYSMVERVIPRYRVLQIVNSKRLLKKKPSLSSVLSYTDEEFMEKFVVKFTDDAEELLVAYKGHMLDSSSSASSPEEEENSVEKESLCKF